MMYLSIMTDRLDDVDRLRIESPLSMATEVITPGNVSTAHEVVSGVIGRFDHHDDHCEEVRQEGQEGIRQQGFGREQERREHRQRQFRGLQPR